MPTKLILVGGVPGSGKTYIGKELARRIGVFVDKDTISRFFAEPMLKLLGSHADDRESETYLANVRNVEYETMMKHAMENLELGRSVICSAPFIREFNDEQWLDDIQLEAELIDAEVVKIWIHVDPATARERIVARGASRDLWKLANWDTYLAGVPESAPSADIIVIDNSRVPSVPLFEQIEAISDRLAAIQA